MAKVSMASVARAIGLGQTEKKRLEAQGQVVYQFLDEGHVEALYNDEGGSIRSDKVSHLKINWLLEECWCSSDFTRESGLKNTRSLIRLSAVRIVITIDCAG
eukprot:3716649-Pleurochrysis_carterae.AAC.1